MITTDDRQAILTRAQATLAAAQADLQDAGATSRRKLAAQLRADAQQPNLMAQVVAILSRSSMAATRSVL
jgi:hypothetical protein